MDHRQRTTTFLAKLRHVASNRLQCEMHHLNRKDLGFHLRITPKYEDYILAITVHIDNKKAEFMNVYDRDKNQTRAFLQHQKPLTDCLVAENFKPHHPKWYVQLAASGPEVISASARSAEFLMDWAIANQFNLLKIP